MLFFLLSLFEPIYNQTKQSHTKKMCSTIATIYKEHKEYNIPELAINNGVDAVVFRVENGTAIVLYNGTRISENNEQLLQRMQIFYNRLSKNNVKVVDYTAKENNTKIVCSGMVEEVDGTNIYFLVSTRLTPDTGAVKVINITIIFVLGGSIIIAVILSLIFSKSISSPLQKMCLFAKNLNVNNFEVNFDAHGYTEVEQLSSTLNFAVKELKKTDELRNEVISNVSHELRTPLTMIKSYAELIKDINGNDPLKRESNLNTILQEASRLELLLNDMLDFSKLKSGTTIYNFTEFNLYDLLNKQYLLYSTKYCNEGYSFEFRCAKNVKVTADYNRIEQVIVNLLNNAINYSKNNKKIIIEVIKQQDSVYRLNVTDHGIGISQENLNNIFDRHFRATNAKRTTVGSGIGLSIVKQILDDHKFTYGVVSELNKGSTFYVNFKINN